MCYLNDIISLMMFVGRNYVSEIPNKSKFRSQKLNSVFTARLTRKNRRDRSPRQVQCAVCEAQTALKPSFGCSLTQCISRYG